MKLNDYQLAAERTAIYPEAGSMSFNALEYTVLGLAGEAGEVANKLKKVIRDDGRKLTTEKWDALFDELGDALWYVSAAATELGVNLSTVAEHNIAKLTERQEKDALRGSGDSR